MLTGTFEEIKTTKNVIGYYQGVEEPDRYIIFGNHRDAWVFGAMDPNSGTTIMIEGFYQKIKAFITFVFQFLKLLVNYTNLGGDLGEL